MNKYLYENYTGDGDFIFIRCTDADRACVVPLANFLAERGVRIFFDIQGSDDKVSPQKIAGMIEKSSAAIFYISDGSCKNLEFRNSINYAAEIKKRIIWIAEEHTRPTGGIEMQLANAERIGFEGSIDCDNMFSTLTDKEVITQAVLGGIPKVKPPGKGKKWLLTLIIVFAVLAFGYAAWNMAVSRVRYYRSAEWLLRDSDGKNYVSLQGAGEDGIRALKGMTVKELDLRKSDITDMSGIEDVDVMLLDLGDCSNIANMDAITKSGSLKRVRIPEDMVGYVRDLPPADIEFELTEAVSKE